MIAINSNYHLRASQRQATAEPRIFWRPVKESLKSAAPLLLVPALVAVLFRKVLRLWWMYDDPFQLGMLRDSALASLLTTKDFYGGSSVFTPLLILSLKLDHALFGVNA